MRSAATVMLMGFFVAMVIGLAGCGGGGGGGGGGSDSGNNGASSTVGVAKQGTWTGKYSSIDRQTTTSSSYSDLILNGGSIDKMYVVGSPKPQSISLYKNIGFTGNAYQTSDGYTGMYFDTSGNHMGMIYGAANVAVYQHDSIPTVVAKKEAINGVWAGSFFYKDDRDGAIHQYQVDVTCHYQICTFNQGELVIDFVKPFYSQFYPEGTWYGREANSGSRFLTTALMSGDLQFMIMPLCWHSFPIGNEGFFDICQTAVLTKTSSVINNTASAGTNQNLTIFNALIPVTLDGSKSQSESGTLTYSWRMVSMPAKSAAALSSSNAVNPTFIVDRPGVYVAGLVVSDSGVDSAESTVTVTVGTSGVYPPKLGLVATGKVNSVELVWSDPYSLNIDHIEIFRNAVDDLGTRQLIATSPPKPLTYTDTPPFEQPFSHDYYYWVRAVDYSGIAGPFSGTAGVPGRPLNAP